MNVSSDLLVFLFEVCFTDNDVDVVIGAVVQQRNLRRMLSVYSENSDNPARNRELNDVSDGSTRQTEKGKRKWKSKWMKGWMGKR